ncbi:DNA-binding response regulator, OmpR family, contains REC and winged-helix (wHTH) domain [Chryseobacterium arachidis]|uniref:DNA-binding response regulator, OmpR family, contains REC and winged-helix (WHTH) domain n=1 Tax=Chryseobacterium arachidis TaxID=1416778 RepID=A0A1M4Y3Y1_9FLAO|nr:response regulator transcription factor [Chryseobacterium arachidis]SHF00293.1 DNA-binding response regulator, OmpR family, contains REC and winged-helix (wHTH) domain [Chryseobacterium arachidis]
MKILIIEDNKELAKSMEFYLEGENYICECAYSYNEALERLTFNSYDCILLDIMLPDGNGLNILNYIKTEKINSGILIISAKNALDDKINGLEKGADDYITKPFHLPELHARLRAVYRRNKMDGYNEVRFNEIILNTDTYEVSINETRLEVTQKEFELLLYFLVNKNRVLSKQSIANHLWGDYTDNLANFDFVYQHVKNLRKKIASANGNDYIETIYGLGYKFNALKYNGS